MPVPPFLRSFAPLLIGLAVGGVGVTLFRDSLPGGEGSPQERANKLEVELHKAQSRIAALEAANAPHTPVGVLGKIAGGAGSMRDGRHTFADGARRIAEDLREGRPVSPDDIFRASQPLMRDLAPLFDRMRLKEERRLIETKTGELARKYNLTPEKQQQLTQWFEAKAIEDAKRWNELIARDGTRLEDVMKATRDVRPDEGLEKFMPSILDPEQAAAFKSERLAERAQRVEQHADGMVQRLNGIVGLDESQRDQIFGIAARGSPDYDPAMMLEGARGQIPATAAANPLSAILEVLTPDQRAAFEAERNRRREAASKEMEAMGLTLPSNWEMFDQDHGFR